MKSTEEQHCRGVAVDFVRQRNQWHSTHGGDAVREWIEHGECSDPGVDVEEYDAIAELLLMQRKDARERLADAAGRIAAFFRGRKAGA